MPNQLSTGTKGINIHQIPKIFCQRGAQQDPVVTVSNQQTVGRLFERLSGCDCDDQEADLRHHYEMFFEDVDCTLCVLCKQCDRQSQQLFKVMLQHFSKSNVAHRKQTEQTRQCLLAFDDISGRGPGFDLQPCNCQNQPLLATVTSIITHGQG